MKRGLIVAAVHVFMVLTLAGKFAWDRHTLPRVWARAEPVDPNLPVRGRYVSLRLMIDAPDGVRNNEAIPVRLQAVNGRLVARRTNDESNVRIRWFNGHWSIREPVAFFLPEHAADPSVLRSGEELWVEASVPRLGPPRPVRLAVKKDGVMTPITQR
jgi:hypothetical protein